MCLCKESCSLSSLANDDLLRRCWSNGIGSRRDVGGYSDSSYLGSVMLVVQFGVMLTRRQIQEGDVE